MNPDKDAFGHELMEYYENGQSFEIIEMDDGYITSFSNGPDEYFDRYEDWAEKDRKAVDKAKGKVLDVGCGAGRHCLYLQEKGYEVLGIDKSPLAIEVCNERCVERARIMDLWDMGDLNETFDTVLFMGNNFGLAGTPEKTREMLEMLHNITPEDGIIIGECEDPYEEEDDGRELDRGQKKAEIGVYQKLRFRFKQYKGEWFKLLLLSRKELKELLEDTKWKVREFIGDEGKSCYNFVLEKEN